MYNWFELIIFFWCDVPLRQPWQNLYNFFFFFIYLFYQFANCWGDHFITQMINHFLICSWFRWPWKLRDKNTANTVYEGLALFRALKKTRNSKNSPPSPSVKLSKNAQKIKKSPKQEVIKGKEKWPTSIPLNKKEISDASIKEGAIRKMREIHYTPKGKI